MGASSIPRKTMHRIRKLISQNFSMSYANGKLHFWKCSIRYNGKYWKIRHQLVCLFGMMEFTRKTNQKTKTKLWRWHTRTISNIDQIKHYIIPKQIFRLDFRRRHFIWLRSFMPTLCVYFI